MDGVDRVRDRWRELVAPVLDGARHTRSDARCVDCGADAAADAPGIDRDPLCVRCAHTRERERFARKKERERARNAKRRAQTAERKAELERARKANRA